MPEQPAAPDGWNDFLTERDRAVFAAAGYGVRARPGARPVVLVVDVTYGFCGDRPEPVLESIKRWRTSCGEAAWAAFPHVNRLTATARRHGVPVVYTRGTPRRADGLDRGRWAAKNSRQAFDPPESNDIVAEIAPESRDIVIQKTKPSAFFGTPLLSYLVQLGADSLVVCGATTSGCVRATVVDAFSYNFQVSIAREATFDRAESSHWIGLLDMDMKYADVLSVDELVSQLDSSAADLPATEATT